MAGSPNLSHKTSSYVNLTNDAQSTPSLNESRSSLTANTTKDLEELLIYSARTGDTTTINEILDRKEEYHININALGARKWDRGCSALHIAAYFGNKTVVDLLLSQPEIDVNVRNDHLETPLHKAALTGRIDIVDAILTKNPDLSLLDEFGRTAAQITESDAIKRRLEDMEKNQKSRRKDSLISICREGDIEQLRKILNSEENTGISCVDEDGNNLLYHAAFYDQKEMASILLQYGCDPNKKNSKGRCCFDLELSEKMRRILEIKPPEKKVPQCVSKQGTLLRCSRLWNIWRKNEVLLHRGTISFYRHKKHIGNEKLRRVYKHLDGAGVYRVKRSTDFYVRFTDGSTIWLRVPKSSDHELREEWVSAIKSHIAYCNYYIGLSDQSEDSRQLFLQTTERAYVDAKTAVDAFVNQISRLRTEMSALPSMSPWTDVLKSAENAIETLKRTLEIFREEDKIRDNKLFEERERCRVLENALQVLAHEHEAMLSSMEHLASTSHSSTNSVYYSPPESIDDATELHSNNGDLDEDERSLSVYSAEEGTPVETYEEASSTPEAEIDRSGISASTAATSQMPSSEISSGDHSGVSAVQRSRFGGRTQLPVPQFSRGDFSVWSVLKQCIGKDLSKVTMPVVFNEPLSFLQRMSEYMEYAQLLDQAANCEDPVERILYVTAFAVSACGSNADRIGKPFNPLLGETFELSRPEYGYRMVAEQVSHHPPVSAFHASTDTWNFYGSILPKLKFWGKSVEIQPKGTVTLELKKFKEAYSWSNVNCQVNNIIVGKLWIEQYGTMEIVNRTTGLTAVLNFHPSGWVNRELHKVNGYVIDRNKKQLKAVFGKWTDFLRYSDVEAFERYFVTGSAARRRSSSEIRSSTKLHGKEQHSSLDGHDDFAAHHSHSERTQHSPDGLDTYGELVPHSKLLWRVDPRPTNSSMYYNFTLFAMSLNEIDASLKDILPPTDSRFRPDMRLLENGDLDNAANEKNRLEEKQRAVRRTYQKETGKDEWAPLWFVYQKNPHTGQDDWIFNWKYWNRDFAKCRDIF